MSSLEFNKIAGAVLTTAIVAMTIGFAGEILVPKGGHGGGHGDASAAHATAKPGKGGAAPKQVAKKPEKPLDVKALLAAGDAAKGKKIAKRCVACHSLDKGGKNKTGPNLYGIVGRARAGVGGFKYSSALKAKTGNWNYEDLFAFLANPGRWAKGTSMSFKLSKPKQRADLIAYLRTLHDSPPPPPAE